MLNIVPLSNAGNYAAYLEKEGIGEWIGKGAESLGLTGEVRGKMFEGLQSEYGFVRRGEDPRTGEPLRPVTNVDRHVVKPWGEERIYHAREVYDVVISPPKTFSIQYLTDSRILEFHERAVRATVQGVERFTGGLVVAAYQHRTSRRLDPQIHSHLLTGNVCVKDGHWRALNASFLYRNKEELTAYYQGVLFKHAERAGYQVKDGDIKGISQELYVKFSQRSADRERAIAQYRVRVGFTDHEMLTGRQVAQIVYHDRNKKEVLPPDVIRQSQLARLTPAEHTQLLELKDEALERQSLHERVASTPETETPKDRRKLSLRDGVHSEPDLKHEEWNYGESPSYRAGYKVRL